MSVPTPAEIPAAKAVPDDVKKPEDHKMPSDEPKFVDIVGVRVELSPNLADDFDLMMLLSDAQQGDLNASVELLRKLLGGKFDDVRQALRERDGYVSIKAILDVTTTIMGELGN